MTPRQIQLFMGYWPCPNNIGVIEVEQRPNIMVSCFPTIEPPNLGVN
eukprot:CAMPEP_0203751530 /NCGR_PEP_ID=MMETSP0098-20131031/5580_1 /ASSEMBLY_ACC=CAM_ASM_000208 /TAXON_ID=96639 /ORGANISM=" , Strain NY0313808BC1" /LENGTH=46 /DNA_ID= /DNA_START= /DNA_END= /DNA_ORIENTATION=